MKVVIIDNYDSFTFNLAHLVKELGADVTVLRNDQFQLPELERFDKIILSPGPGIPSEAGLLMDVIRKYAGRKPMLPILAVLYLVTSDRKKPLPNCLAKSHRKS